MAAFRSEFLNEHQRFLTLFSGLPQFLQPIEINQHIYTLNCDDTDTFDLVISTLIHGNEIGGLIALNTFLEDESNYEKLQGKRIAFVLGNLVAAEKNVRFVERDLNRCFGGGNETDTREDQIARQLEPYLKKTSYALDLHQTINPTSTDFFIFPEDKANILFAQHLDKTIPIVVHEKEFSKDGMCLDTYVTIHGGVGITYEMGQIGLSADQLQKTLEIIEKAINFEKTFLRSEAEITSSIYMWGEVFYSAANRHLVPGLRNFSFVSAGEVIGYENEIPITISKNGFILFPKYGEAAKMSAELCRTICLVSADQWRTLQPILMADSSTF